MPRGSKLGIQFKQHSSKEDKNLYLREWRKRNPNYDKEHRNDEKVRESAWKRRYGITREDYNKMLLEQEGKCSICRTSEIGRGHTYFHVDHNHSTGKVRGLLCDLCNRGLGYFKDSAELLEKAKKYLDENN